MPTIVKVIRIIQYEGTEEAVRKAIQLSKSLGEHQYNGYVMTVAEHSNELPVLIELLPEQVENDLKRGSKFNPELLGLSAEDGPFIRAFKELKSLAPKPIGCCCPPDGYAGLWAAGPCPVHHGLRRLDN